MGGAIVVIIISVVIISVALIVRKQKEEAAIDNGDMIKRDTSFFKQYHTFKTSIDSVNKIYDALDKSAFSRDNMECLLTSEKNIVFKKYIAGQGMTAALRFLGENDGVYTYKFSVESFTTRNGGEAGNIDANIALTTVEKAIFKLDSSAHVERTNGSYKTKW